MGIMHFFGRGGFVFLYADELYTYDLIPRQLWLHYYYHFMNNWEA